MLNFSQKKKTFEAMHRQQGGTAPQRDAFEVVAVKG